MARSKKNTIDDLLRLKDDDELCDGVYDRLSDALDASGRSPKTEAERVVVLTWEAKGVADNGGFQYLLETQFQDDRDPGFRQTADALRILKAPGAEQAVRSLVAWFPKGVPDDFDARLKAYRKIPERDREAANNLYWDDGDLIVRQLAQYIRRNTAAINEALQSPRK